MNEADQQATQGADGGGAGRGLLEQLRAVWKHRFLVLAVAAATAAVVALWTLRQPKVYAATVSIEFDPNPPRPLGRAVEDVDTQSISWWSTREYYMTQLRVIQSERVAEGVVRQLGLQHDADFLGVPLARRRGFRPVDVTTAAQMLRARMRVDPVKDTRLITVLVEDTSPRRAQLLANTIATVYIRQNQESKLSNTVSALEWLGQQMESMRAQLNESEMELHRYREHNNLLSVSFEDRRNHVANRIEKLSESLTDTQIRRIQVQARVNELRRAAAADDPLIQEAPDLLSSGLLQSFRGSLEQARRERDALATRYGRQSLQMEAAESKVQELVDAIRHEVRNTLGASEADLRTMRTAEGQLRTSLQEAQREGLELNLREIEYGRLVRERDNNAKLFALLLQRDTETGLTRLARVNNMRVLDNALMPGAPIKPRASVNIMAGVLGGFALGLLLAFLLVQLDRTVRSPHDIEETLKATFLGMMPRIEAGLRLRYRYVYGPRVKSAGPVTNPDMIVHTHPNSPAAEACRVVRTNLLFMSPDEPFQTLMVASANPEEGKTTVAISLALTLAQSGKRVLLIDTDLRRPRIHKSFGVKPPVGITSVLVNEATLDEAVYQTEIPNVWLLPCGPIPPNPSELLHSHRFNDLLKQARAKFERVIMDTPPIGAVTDALVIGPQVDGAVLVVRARSTVRARAASVLGQLRHLGARIAGVVLNDVQLSKEGGQTYFYGASYDYRPREQEEAA